MENRDDDTLKCILPVGNSNPFTEQYIALRKREQRIYTDHEVLNLPVIPGNHIHAREWLMRKHSCTRLINYLKIKQPLEILEMGCGNGWLSHQLSNIAGTRVTGMDINEVELKQAERVFAGFSNLSFLYGDVHQLQSKQNAYDIIIFAASIQYFSSFEDTVSIALSHLEVGGELHIIDSPFYKLADLSAARQRTKDYFLHNGFQGMESHYFHHSLESVRRFNHTVLYSPHFFKMKLPGIRSPFHWIRITK